MAQVISMNDIIMTGTPEHIDELNNQLRRDMQIYATRPFLSKQERHDLGDYYSTWGINKIIALMNFDKAGNFLPQVYQAPAEYLKMLYPIDDIMSYDRQGTLVIDREQYSPELRKLSFFIYMVDAEMYDQYKAAQNFRGDTAPTFMFNQHANDGVRIFRDYYALARHLRKQRFVTYVLGPRTMFYLRYFIYQIHVHTIDQQYVWGEQVDGSLANSAIESIKRHLAFNASEKLNYEVNITVDKYKEYRLLMNNAHFKMNLPEAKTFHSNTDIIRYKKQQMNNHRPLRLKRNKVRKYNDLGIMPYHHMVFTKEHAFFYIWDTRVIDKIMPIDDVNFEDFAPVEFDNGFDLVCKWEAPAYIREICETARLQLAIQMRDGELILASQQ